MIRRAKKVKFATAVLRAKRKVAPSAVGKRRKKRSPYKILMLGLFFSFIAAIVYFSIFWPGWQIKQITISLPQSSSLEESAILANIDQSLDKKYFDLVSQQNIIVTSANLIRASLKQSFPQIEDVIVEKEISPKIRDESKGSILKIVITEKESVAIWCEAQIIVEEPKEEGEVATTTEEVLVEEEEAKEKVIENCFYLDKQGIVFGQSPIFEGGLVLSIHDFRSLQPNLGSQVLPEKLMDMLLRIYQKVPNIFQNTPASKGLGISALEMHVIEELNIITNEGWIIQFNTNLTADKQLTVLRSTLLEEIGANRQTLEYIDLRIESRAYYK